MEADKNLVSVDEASILITVCITNRPYVTLIVFPKIWISMSLFVLGRTYYRIIISSNISLYIYFYISDNIGLVRFLSSIYPMWFKFVEIRLFFFFILTMYTYLLYMLINRLIKIQVSVFALSFL